MAYSKKIATVKNLLRKNSIDAFLISSHSNITYLTGYAGFSQTEREAYLLLTKTHSFLFTDGRYSEAIKILAPHFTLCKIAPEKPFTKHLEVLVKKHSLKTIGFEADNLTVSEYIKMQKIIKLRSVEINNLRSTKTPQEVQAIQKACSIGDKAFAYIRSIIKPRMTETEIADELEWFIRKHKGALSFPSIVAFGKNSAIPHHQTGNQRLKRNDIVLLDFGVKVNNYCSDMTRTFFIGKINEEQKKVYETVKNAQQKSIAYIKASLEKDRKVSAAKADLVAREYILKQGFTTIPHAVGHGIGIEVHEAPTLSPRSKGNLTDDMVFSIEPGIYLPAGKHGLPGKFGVRIEDLFTIQKGKLIQLTKSPTYLHQI